ncbi:hypothetical protein [Longispora albida]|uniref:hypothetical protein n=1 Tax=Longispora albida TaxID=203523 RepID=UPI00035DA02D|nr:hypothetical protein [Longispora albida]
MIELLTAILLAALTVYGLERHHHRRPRLESEDTRIAEDLRWLPAEARAPRPASRQQLVLTGHRRPS